MYSSFVYINQNNELEKATLIDPSITNNIATISTSNVIFGNSTKNANFKFKDVTFENNLNINKNLNMYGNINIIDGLILPNNNQYNSFQGSIYYNDTNHKYYGYYGDTKEWKSLGSGSSGNASSISGELNQNLDINGNLNVESLNIKSSITLDNNTKLTINDLESVADVEGWSQNGFGENRYWTKYYNFNTTSSMIPNINKILYNEENCVLEWNRNMSQLQFKANLPVNSTSSNLIYPRYVAQTSLTKQTIFEKKEHTPYMIANGLSEGFPFLTPDFQPNHNFSPNMNNGKNDILFKADGSIIIDSNINNHNSTYPSIFFKYYVNSSNNVNMYLKTTKKPAKSILEFSLTFDEADITLDALKQSGAIETARSELKAQFSATFNVPESDIIITFVDGSVIATVQVSTNQPTQTESTITTDLPTATYPVVLGNLNQSIPITPTTIVKTIVSHPKHPVLIEPGFLLTNNSFKTGLSGHIGEIALQMPIKLFTFDIPIDFVNTTGDSKKITLFNDLQEGLSFNINSESTIIKKSNVNEIILDISHTDLQLQDKFNKISNFYLEADSESFKSTSLSALHVESNLNKNNKNYLKIDKIFQVTEQKNATYLTENLNTVGGLTFNPTTTDESGLNPINIYQAAQQFTITMTFNKKLKTDPYLEIINKNEFYNGTLPDNIKGSIQNADIWAPQYKFTIPGNTQALANRKTYDTNGDRNPINFKIVDGQGLNIKHVFDKSYDTTNTFYVSDDSFSPVISGGTLTNVPETPTDDPKTLVYVLDFQESVSSKHEIPNSGQTFDLTIDNFDIDIVGSEPHIQTDVDISQTSLVKDTNEKYTLTITLNHQYYTSNHTITINKSTNNPIYDRNFNVFSQEKQITLSDNKPARINTTTISPDNQTLTFTFSEQVIKVSNGGNIDYTDITLEYDNTVLASSTSVTTTNKIEHQLTFSDYIKTHQSGTITPYRLDIYPNSGAIKDLHVPPNVSLQKQHQDYNILNPPIGQSLGKYSVYLNIIPYIESIIASKTLGGGENTGFRSSDSLHITLKISPNITHPTSLPILTFDNSNPFYNDPPSFTTSSTNTSNSYYTEIEYVYTLKSNIDISTLNITDIDRTNLKYSNNNQLNIGDLSSKTPTLDIYTIIPVFTNQIPERNTNTPTQVNITLDWLTTHIIRPINANDTVVEILNITTTPTSQSPTLQSSSSTITNFHNTTTTDIILDGLTDGIVYSFDMKLTILGNPYTKNISFDTILPTVDLYSNSLSGTTITLTFKTNKSITTFSPDHITVSPSNSGTFSTFVRSNNGNITNGTHTTTFNVTTGGSFVFSVERYKFKDSVGNWNMSYSGNSPSIQAPELGGFFMDDLRYYMYKQNLQDSNETRGNIGYSWIQTQRVGTWGGVNSVDNNYLYFELGGTDATSAGHDGSQAWDVTKAGSNNTIYAGNYYQFAGIENHGRYGIRYDDNNFINDEHIWKFEYKGQDSVGEYFEITNTAFPTNIHILGASRAGSGSGVTDMPVTETVNGVNKWYCYVILDAPDKWLIKLKPSTPSGSIETFHTYYSSHIYYEYGRFSTSLQHNYKFNITFDSHIIYPLIINIDSTDITISDTSVTVLFTYNSTDNPRGQNVTSIELTSSTTGSITSSPNLPLNPNDSKQEIDITGLSPDTSYTIKIKFSDNNFDPILETEKTINVTTLKVWQHVADISFNGSSPINSTKTGTSNRFYEPFWTNPNGQAWLSSTHGTTPEYIMLDFEFKFTNQTPSGAQYLFNIGGFETNTCPQWTIDFNQTWLNTPVRKMIITNNCMTAPQQSWVSETSNSSDGGIAEGEERGNKPGVGLRSKQVFAPGINYKIKVMWEARLPDAYTQANAGSASVARRPTSQGGLDTTEIYLYIDSGSGYVLDTFTDNYAQSWSYSLGANYPPATGWGGEDSGRHKVGLTEESNSKRKFFGIGGNSGWGLGLKEGVEIKVTQFCKVKKNKTISIAHGAAYNGD